MAKTLLDKEVLNHYDLRELLGERPHGKYPEGLFDKPAVKSNGTSTSKEVKEEEKEASEE